MTKKLNLFLLISTALFFSSCASMRSSTVIVPYTIFPSTIVPKTVVPRAIVPASVPVVKPPVATIPQVVPVVLHSDKTHVVSPGETIGILSQMYDVPASSIVSANHLKKNAKLPPGKSLVIPQAAPLRSVITLFPNKKWKYIIIHHSATERGDSLAFHGAHLKRGFKGGVGYDFVIDNGTLGKEDGEIEMTPRWLKQEDGRHCKASNMNKKAIGICLVGNFDTGKISEKQMASLAYLVNTLRHYYKIPVPRIMGHGQVRGAETDCPGKKFTWQEFHNRLKIIF